MTLKTSYSSNCLNTKHKHNENWGHRPKPLWQCNAHGATCTPTLSAAVRPSRRCSDSIQCPEVRSRDTTAPRTTLALSSGADHFHAGVSVFRCLNSTAPKQVGGHYGLASLQKSNSTLSWKYVHHAEFRIEVDNKITNNRGWGNSGCPHVKRNLWSLELPMTRVLVHNRRLHLVS